MKKIGIVLLIICLFFSVNISFAVEIVSPNYAVYNADNLKLILGENNESKVAIASITKVMTSIVAIEKIKDLNENVNIDTSVISGKVDPDLVTAGIYTGQNLTYYDLLCATLVSSSADCAVYLANVLYNSQDEFIEKMNEKAKEIGMNKTHFSNVSGLDDEENYSTLDDVAKMIKYAMTNTTLKEIMSLKEYTMSDGSIKCVSTIDKQVKKENILNSHIIGGKTGTTGDAGLCLASFSNDDGVDLICVVTGVSMYSSKAYNTIDTNNIYEEIINNYSMQNIVSKDEVLETIESVCTKQKNVDIISPKNVKIYVDKINTELLNVKYDGVKSVDYTSKKGDKLGQVEVYYDNDLVDTFEVYLNEELEFSLVEWIKLNKEAIIVFSGGIIVILTVMFIVRKK